MVDGINNLSNVELVKKALENKGVNTTTTLKPTWLTPEGSIYNAPQLKLETNKKEVKELKTLDVNNLKTQSACQQALNDIETFEQQNPILKYVLKDKKNEIIQKKNNISISNSQTNLQNISEGNSASQGSSTSSTISPEDKQKQEAAEKAKNISASEGRKMAAEMNQQKSNVENQTKTTEKNTKIANNYAKEAQKDQKSIIKQQKNLEKQNKSATKQIQQNQQEILKLTESMNAENEEVNSLQAELERLTAGDNTGVGINSAFSLSLAGTQEQEEAAQNDPNAERIAELQGQISAKTSSMKTTGAKIGKLQTQTNKQIKTMHKVSIKYMANIQRTQGNLQANSKASDDILKVANKVDEISSTIATAGTTLKYTGSALIALGSSTSWCFGAGAALIAAGQVMEKAGSVAEVVGQYGQVAAGVTKTACYAAQGNLAGALTSAGSAIMSGTSAVKNTQQLGSTFKQIEQKATEATQKLAAGVAAKETVKEMGKDGLGNLSKKQATQLAREAAMNNLEGTSTSAIKEAFKNGATGAAAKDLAKSGAATAISTAKDVTAGMTKQQIKEAINSGLIHVASNSSQVVKEAASELAQEGTKTAKKGIKGFFSSDNMQKIGQKLNQTGTAMAAKMGALGGGAASKGQNRTVTPFAPVSPSILAQVDMMNQQQMRRLNAYSRRYA